MRSTRSTLLLALGMTCAAASDAPVDPDDHWDSDEPLVFIEGSALHYYGKLNKAGESKVRDRLAIAPPALSALHVASTGGDALPAIAIAEQIHVRGLEVVVVGKGCGSACANYLFTPARQRTISPDSVVMWHNSCPNNIGSDREEVLRWLRQSYGTAALSYEYTKDGVVVDDPEALRENFEMELEKTADTFVEYVTKYTAAHRRIFDGLPDIDPRVICLTDYIDLPEVPAGVVSYTYTLPIEDMARFGVCGVKARADYAEWAEGHIKENDPEPVSMGVIRLAGYPDFSPRYPLGHCGSGIPSSG